jgi:hypothetical protein
MYMRWSSPWKQATGQVGTQSVNLQPLQFPVTTWGMVVPHSNVVWRWINRRLLP